MVSGVYLTRVGSAEVVVHAEADARGLHKGDRKRALGQGRTSTKSSTRRTSWRRRECTHPSHARKSSSVFAHTSTCTVSMQPKRSRACLVTRSYWGCYTVQCKEQEHVF